MHTVWSSRAGAPIEPRALAQTSDGYLWIAGQRGLVRFDGIRFVPFVPPDTGLRNLSAGRLLASRDGGLWVVWAMGAVSRLESGRLSTWRESDGLPATFDLAESSTGILVAGTAKGLWQFSDGKWRDASSEWRLPGEQGRAVWFDRGDGLWVETESRVVRLPRGDGQIPDSGLRLLRSAVKAEFAQERDGTVWMTELYRSTHDFPRADDPRRMTEIDLGGWSLLVDRKGSLWVGTLGDGLRRIVDPGEVRGRIIAKFGKETEAFSSRDGLQSDVIYSVLEDREGSIWVAGNRGLERFRDGAFTPVVPPGSMRAHYVYATRDSALWIGGYGRGGYQRLDPRSRKMEEIGERFVPLTDRFVPLTLYQDPSGTIWTLNGEKVFRFDPVKRDFVALPLRRNDAKFLRDIVVDPAGTIWLFDESVGLMRLAGDSLIRVAALPPAIDLTGSLFRDRQGRIWIAQFDQLGVYEHGRLRLFPRGEIPARINTFFEDRAGNLWAASNAGLSRFDGDRFRTLPEHQGVPERFVYGVAIDQDDAWWLATRTGVLRLPPGEAERAMADSTHVLQYRRFDHRDGLPGVIVSSAQGQLITRGADGRIWVGADSGVASIDPRRLPPPVVTPVLVESVRVDDREIPLSGAVTIPPGGRDLEIDYTSTALAVADRVQFRYQLEGEDPGWRDVGTRRRAYYTGLGPGRYTFRVTADNGDGIWNEAGAALRFRVLPAWYQTLWAQGALLLLIIGFGAVTAWQVQRQRHARAQQVLAGRYEATLAERARIAQDLHDTVLQGFAGVSMQLKAAERALPDAPDVAAETLMHVQQLTRETLREARERVMDLQEPESGHADLARALEAGAKGLVAGTGITLILTASGERRRLPRALETAAILIGREAIANAVRHAKPRRIEVDVGFEATMLRLEVRDDGSGFTPEQSERAHRLGHLGLTGMQDRAARAGGSCAVRPGSSGGTVVAVVLPISR